MEGKNGEQAQYTEEKTIHPETGLDLDGSHHGSEGDRDTNRLRQVSDTVTDEICNEAEVIAEDVQFNETDYAAFVQAIGSQKDVPGAILIVLNKEADGGQVFEACDDELKPWIGKILMDMGASIMQQGSLVNEPVEEEAAPSEETESK